MTTKIFPASLIKTEDHWAVGTQWNYAKGIVTMHPEGRFALTDRGIRSAANAARRSRQNGVFTLEHMGVGEAAIRLHEH